MERVKEKSCKICCPRCGQRLFRGNRFDIVLDCPNCGSKVEAEREDLKINISLEIDLSED